MTKRKNDDVSPLASMPAEFIDVFKQAKEGEVPKALMYADKKMAVARRHRFHHYRPLAIQANFPGAAETTAFVLRVSEDEQGHGWVHFIGVPVKQITQMMLRGDTGVEERDVVQQHPSSLEQLLEKEYLGSKQNVTSEEKQESSLGPVPDPYQAPTEKPKITISAEQTAERFYKMIKREQQNKPSEQDREAIENWKEQMARTGITYEQMAAKEIKLK